MSYLRHILISTSSLIVLAGCAVSPVSLTEDDYRSIIQADRASWLNNMEAVSGPVSLDEAIARALKYNLDHRVRLLEQAQATANFEAGKFDMLPRLMANAGYNWRDNEAIRDSIDSVTGAPSLANPSISSQRERTNADLTFSWSLLDFGLSYYNARQNADRILVANERRRNAMHTLIRDVTTTYWRALAAQQLGEQVRLTIREAEQALTDSRQILAANINNPTDTLRYQRNLLENLRLLENVERELASARIELATLVSLPPGSQIDLVEPARAAMLALDGDLEELEVIALGRNADLREQSYNARIAAQETRKTLLRMMPGLSFNYGQNFDSDTYLVNEQWNQASVTAGFNLFNTLSAPANRRASEYLASVEEARRMAVQVAVLSQLHLAAHHYNDALRQYDRAEAIFEVDRDLSVLARGQENAQTGSPLERISSEVTQILSSVRMYQSMAQVNEACGRVQATLGLEPQISSLDDTDLQTLRRQIVRSYDLVAASNSQQWSCQVDGTAAAEIAAETAVEIAVETAVNMPLMQENSASPAAELAVIEESAITEVVPQTLAPIVDSSAQESRLQVAQRSIQHWLDAWQGRDMDGYFASYHPEFVPVGFDNLQSWRQQRNRNIRNREQIQLSVRDWVTVAESDGQLTVRFVLDYQSPVYSDITLKQLTLQEDPQTPDRLLIREETNIEVRQR